MFALFEAKHYRIFSKELGEHLSLAILELVDHNTDVVELLTENLLPDDLFEICRTIGPELKPTLPNFFRRTFKRLLEVDSRQNTSFLNALYRASNIFAYQREILISCLSLSCFEHLLQIIRAKYPQQKDLSMIHEAARALRSYLSSQGEIASLESKLEILKTALKSFPELTLENFINHRIENNHETVLNYICWHNTMEILQDENTDPQTKSIQIYKHIKELESIQIYNYLMELKELDSRNPLLYTRLLVNSCRAQDVPLLLSLFVNFRGPLTSFVEAIDAAGEEKAKVLLTTLWELRKKNEWLPFTFELILNRISLPILLKNLPKDVETRVDVIANALLYYPKEYIQSLRSESTLSIEDNHDS
jgi:hypothetical protein